MTHFKALQVQQTPAVTLMETSLTTDKLKQPGLLIKVAYSGINYKDALATIEKGGVIRKYPMTPGIDLAGIVVESDDEVYPVGTPVLATGFGLGVSVPGGFSQYQRVPAEWLVKLPANLSQKTAMIYGTAGFTAALAVATIEKRLTKKAPVVITGASGGVGSIALALLAEKGYKNLTAVSRKAEAVPLLTKLGATRVVTPADLALDTPTPLAKQQYSGVIDTVGGELLENLLPQISYGGIAALCGNAGGIKLKTTVLPFILRGITLQGIDSVNVPAADRPAIWAQLASSCTSQLIQTQEANLAEVPAVIQQLLAGDHTGRTIVKL